MLGVIATIKVKERAAMIAARCACEAKSLSTLRRHRGPRTRSCGVAVPSLRPAPCAEMAVFLTIRVT